MLCEAFRKLLNFADLSKYRYVGFGSTFFTDFSFIHKSLGLKDLVSIEKEREDKSRFRFNCPYKCIRLIFGDATDVLPNLSWSKKIILWLDYDYKIEESMFTDIGIFISRAQSGSLLLLTMDATPDDLPNSPEDKSRYAQLLERVGSIKMPLGISENDLVPKNYPRTCYKIINNEIDESLSKRNGGLENKLIYKQLFNFLYRDSAPMLTIGGIIYSTSDEEKINKCNFEGLEFVKSKRHIFDPYRIIVPNLTFREMRYLDKWLPYDRFRGIDKKANIRFLSSHLIDDYSRIYRYFPNFVEAEMH
jgi:hypothetical protein